MYQVNAVSFFNFNKKKLKKNKEEVTMFLKTKDGIDNKRLQFENVVVNRQGVTAMIVNGETLEHCVIHTFKKKETIMVNEKQYKNFMEI
jgi:hypothetical protein